VAGVRVGHGSRAGSGLGPMIARRHQQRMRDLVEDAVARGAEPVLAGGPVPAEGHFVAPVVLAGVPEEARVMREEIFGPIAPIRLFDDEEEVLALANDRAAGLAAYVYTRDLDCAMRVVSRLEAGVVAVNHGRVSCVAAPFGGVKHSGFGHSGGAEGIDEYLVTRYVTMREARRAVPARPLADVEPDERLRGLRPALEPLDPRLPRPSAAEVDHPLDGLPRPLEHRLDRAVIPVSDPPGDAVPGRRRPRGGPEADALDEPVDDHPHARRRHRPRVVATGIRGAGGGPAASAPGGPLPSGEGPHWPNGAVKTPRSVGRAGSAPGRLQATIPVHGSRLQ
jgi:aldehyde dehydrogenase family protein